MRVLAIGATGFIGPHVVRRLIEGGHEVAVLHRGTSGAGLPKAVQHIRCDRNALAEAAPMLQRLAPDAVLDLVLYTESQAQGLVAALRGAAGRLIVASSADVYRNYDGLRGRCAAPPDPVPLTEEAPLRETRHPYRGQGLALEWADDFDKILVEQIVQREPQLPATILRLPAVYGPGDRQRRLCPYLGAMDEGCPAVMLGAAQAPWRWTRGYVENVAAALALALTDPRASGRTYNVGEEPALTEREWVERIGAAAGRSGEIAIVPDAELPEELRQPYDFRYELATDTSRIRRELGYAELVPLEQALARTIEWERSLPRLEGPRA